MMRKSVHFLPVLLVALLSKSAVKSDTVSELHKIVLMIKECLSNDTFPVVCLKERALESLNRTLFIEEPIMVGFLRIEKNPEYKWNNYKSETLPNEIAQRSVILNEAIYQKLEQFFKSRTIKLNIDEAVEGRKSGSGGGGGGGGKGKGVMMMMGAAAACVGAGMMVGKMGMMAMTALMLSKISLLLSAIMILKKSKGGGGGGDEKEKQIKIVYATTGGGGGGGGGDWNGKGGGGGGGGWHRSIGHDPQIIAYKGQVPLDENGKVYEGY
ncbi:uncharacterized protein [Euwallacea fornicatus]|uniref:uncharacterized protein n=1 Tax=Euwallacea fornicatus TaxID=995702 RepID=UPI0033904545